MGRDGKDAWSAAQHKNSALVIRWVMPFIGEDAAYNQPSIINALFLALAHLLMPQDPVDKNLLRMEARRFASRCEGQIASIERADSLRELVRLAGVIHLSYPLSEDPAARDALHLLMLRSEDRARELIRLQLQNYARVEPYLRDKWRRNLFDSWSNLTGAFAHLRAWAQARLALVEQQLLD